MNKTIISKNKILIIALLGTVLFRLIFIHQLWGPSIIWDEAGYWSHAANIAGQNWTEVVTSWYSYGYSLLLVPLFLFPHNMSLLYKLAIGQNVLLCVGMFFVGIKILEILFDKKNRNENIIISFLAVNCSAFLFQSQITWPETLIYFLFLLEIWLCAKFVTKQNILNTVLLALCSGFIYIVHNRNVIVLIALGIMLALMAIRRELKWMNVFILGAIIVSMYFLNKLMRGYVTDLMWQDGMQSFSGNDASSSMVKFTLFTSINGIKRLIVAFCGKVWNALVSTFLLAGFGISFLFKNIFWGFKKKNWYIYVFVLLCIMGFIGMNTMVANRIGDNNRIDPLFYGRYQEAIDSILIMLGAVEIVSLFDANTNDTTVKIPNIPSLIIQTLIWSAVTLICGFAVWTQVHDIPDAYRQIACVPGTCLLNSFGMIRTSIAVIIVFALAVGISCIAKKINIISAAVIMIASLITYVNAMGFIINRQLDWKNEEKLLEVLNKNDTYSVYYLGTWGDDVSPKAKIRCYVMDNDIHFTFDEKAYEDKNTADNNYFMLAFRDVGTQSVPVGMEIETEALITLEKNKVSEAKLIEEPSPWLLYAHGDELINDLVAEGYSFVE